MKTQKQILILGGGFGGVLSAVLLSKRTDPKDVAITLVDKEPYHTYYPNLYEVASSEEEFTSITDLKHSVAFPFSELPARIKFIQGEVSAIHQKENYIELSGQKISYDFLVVALGATADFFHIPGAKENALTMKSVNDALRIQKTVEGLVEQHRLDPAKKMLRIVIGGGGFSGVELAGELVNLKNILSWKYSYPFEKMEIEIIEGASQLMPGMPTNVSRAVYDRLKKFDVRITLNSMITAVTKNQVNLNNGEVVNYDAFIWTGGVKSVDVPFADKVQTDRKCRCMTEEDLSLPEAPNVFLIGDNACIMDPNNAALPQTATQAISHAEYVAGAIAAEISGKKRGKFVSIQSPYIIPIKGKWALLHLPNGFTMIGFIPWLVKQFANLRYFAKIMPLGKAIRLAMFDAELYTKND